MQVDEEHRRRAKLYSLSDKGEWEDNGTGNVVLISNEGIHYIVLASEDAAKPSLEENCLFNATVSMDDIYKKQQDSIVVFNDHRIHKDVAVSFQRASDCGAFWKELRLIQNLPEEVEEECPESGFSLPEVSAGNLRAILNSLASVNLSFRAQVIAEIIQDNYVDKLVQVFEESERMGNIATLNILFEIFCILVLFNSQQLLDILLGDYYILKVIGALEYDTQIPRQHHRMFLEKTVSFREIIQFDAATKRKIHRLYRIQYVRDVVLPRFLDEPTAVTFNSIILNLQNEISEGLLKETQTLEALVEGLKTTQDNSKLVELVAFCQELVIMSKSLSLQNKSAFFATLCGAGFYLVISDLIQAPDLKVRLSCADILWQSVHQEASVFRGYVTSDNENKKQFPFLKNLVRALKHDSEDFSIKGQLVEILKLILFGASEKADLETLQVFYSGKQGFVDLVCHEILELRDAAQFHILELVSFCISTHPQRTKDDLIRSNIVADLLKSVKVRRRHLMLSIFRLVKAVVLCREESLMNYLIQKNCFEPIVDVLVSNGDRYNLINSTILSIFEFIRKESIGPLCCHVMETYGDRLQGITYVDVFQVLSQKCEQFKQKKIDFPDSAETAPKVTERIPRLPRQQVGIFRDFMDDEDEDYLSTDDVVEEDLGEQKEPVESTRTFEDRFRGRLARPVEDSDLLGTLKNGSLNQSAESTIALLSQSEIERKRKRYVTEENAAELSPSKRGGSNILD